MTPQPSEPRTRILVSRQDLADTACFLDGHKRPSDRSACDGCEDWANSAFAALHARGPAEAAAPDPVASPAPLPPEAVEWARQLLAQGYTDEHIVTFSETAYGLQHPIRCRPDLIGCIFNEWLAGQMAPDEDPGRYVMTWPDPEKDDGPLYARLEGQPEEPA